MTLEQRLSELTSAIGEDVKAILAAQGNLLTLSTTNKTSLVAAINELFGLIGTGGGSAVIDDSAASGSASTYSIDKILALLNGFKQDILGGVPLAAFDTLVEISTYLASDQTATSGLVTAMANRVSVDVAQSFTTEQQAQGRANIGAFGAPEIGNPDTDFLTIYNTAKA